jgi:undecaprenyl diphosphate synthase
MTQMTLQTEAPEGLHVAIIMDGNGRWALRRGLPRSAGHREGARAVRRVVEAAPPLGVGTLTLYAFSGDNWQRPQGEVNTLMELFRDYFCAEQQRWAEQGIRVSVIGRRDRLSPSLRAAVEVTEAATAGGNTMHLRIAVDYSARDLIVQAARRLTQRGEISRQEFSRALAEVSYAGSETPEVDLMIRSGGEQRLSDFLLWESAYAELLFAPKMWPDFTGADLQMAVTEFRARERRFGVIPEVAAS